MRELRILGIMLLASSILSACDVAGGGSPQQQGVKLEDNQQKKDMQFSSPLPNGSPDTPPSEMSASPNGPSQGATPQF